MAGKFAPVRKRDLGRAERLWADLQRDELGGYSGINRPFWIAEQFRQVRAEAEGPPSELREAFVRYCRYSQPVIGSPKQLKQHDAMQRQAAADIVRHVVLWLGPPTDEEMGHAPVRDGDG